jgi:hypothetical protein
MFDSLSCSFTSISFLIKSLFLYFNLCLSVMLETQIKVKEQWFNKKWYGCKWTWETIQHYTRTQIKVKEQWFNKKGYGCKWTWETIQHTSISFLIKSLFLYFNLCLSVMLDSLSCSFTSISFLIKSLFLYFNLCPLHLDTN